MIYLINGVLHFWSCTDVLGGKGNDYSSGAPELIASVCMVFYSLLFVLFPLESVLSFLDSRLMMTLFVSSNFSLIGTTTTKSHTSLTYVFMGYNVGY